MAFVLTIFHKTASTDALAASSGAPRVAPPAGGMGGDALPPAPSFDAAMPFRDVLREGLGKGGSTPIRFLANLSHRNPMHVVQRGTCTVLEAVQALISAKAHRLVVLDGDVFYGILSATTVLEWVADHFGGFLLLLLLAVASARKRAKET